MTDRPDKLDRDRRDLIGMLARLRSPKISARVLAAFERVPRERFVSDDLAELAYEDHPLPIGADQTISQPSLVARMTQWVDPRPDDIALEIGTGCGYQAAVLAELVAHVYSVERIAKLGEAARLRLAQLGYTNVSIRTADGWEGWREFSPFDVIVVTAATPRVPPALVDQLAAGGRMILPLGHAPGLQELCLIHKSVSATVESRKLGPVSFVPLERGVADLPATPHEPTQ